MLGSNGNPEIDHFISRGTHEDSDVYYLSQSYIDSQKEL